MTDSMKQTKKELERDLRKARIKKTASADILEKIEARKQEKDAEGSLKFINQLERSAVEHASMES